SAAFTNALNFSGFFILDRSLALRLKTRTVGCLRGEIAEIDRGLFVFIKQSAGGRMTITLALFFKQHG
ncbi:MAG TPA: hypothetical protein VN825_09720, partial [Candidatus Acidoferrum sp.]|nr:hypothetical protein [Candidatus Acidoferrum sp.]